MTALVCRTCGAPVERAQYLTRPSSGHRRPFIHLDPATGRPVPADHTPRPTARDLT